MSDSIKCPVITMGYQTFYVDSDFMSVILEAAATGRIMLADKNYDSVKNSYTATIKGMLDISVEHVYVVEDCSAEIAELKARLQVLEGTANA